MTNLVDAKKGSQLIQRLRTIQNDLEAHLYQFLSAGLALPDPKLSHGQCLKVWEAHSHDWLGLEPDKGGRNGADLLFIACCYRYASQHPEAKLDKLADSLDAKKVVLAVRQIGICLPDDPTKDLAKEFQTLLVQCAALVLFKAANNYTEIIQRSRGFQMDFGDPKEEYKGETAMMATADGEDLMDAKQKLELEQLEEAERQADLALRDARLANDFLPICTRIFLHGFYEQHLFNQFQVKPALPVLSTSKYMEWARKRLQVDPPESFLSRFEAWTYRQLTPIGAQWNLRRRPGDRNKTLPYKDLYQREGIPTTLPLKQWTEEKPLAILEDAKHPLQDMLHLALYSSMFDCAYTTQLEYRRKLKQADGNFVDNFVVFRDEVTAERAWIHEQEAPGLMLRRPLLVQIGRQWFVQDRQCWYPADNMVHALMQWGLLIDRDYQRRVSYSCDISHWLGQFRVGT